MRRYFIDSLVNFYINLKYQFLIEDLHYSLYPGGNNPQQISKLYSALSAFLFSLCLLAETVDPKPEVKEANSSLSPPLSLSLSLCCLKSQLYITFTLTNNCLIHHGGLHCNSEHQKTRHINKRQFTRATQW
jgi:hypothetical protein